MSDATDIPNEPDDTEVVAEVEVEAAPEVRLFGIRHHGPGSAFSLARALDDWQPDCILIEGPPEGDDLLHLAASEEMQPPVALLTYVPTQPSLSVFCPFAEFSPEWQAIRHGLSHSVPTRFIDLPQTHQLAARAELEKAMQEALEKAASEKDDEDATDAAQSQPSAPDDQPDSADIDAPEDDQPDTTAFDHPALDPLDWIGRAAGYADGEGWWEDMVEQRQDSSEIFAAVAEAMTAVRADFPRERTPDDDLREARREAHMRKCIRKAQKDGFVRVAVVCGAWHVPALAAKVKIKDDNALLKGLPKIKTQTTWVPWTYGRLSTASGYGAGVTSPGWYDHLWACKHLPSRDPLHISSRWLTRIARLLRDHGIDCSSAHVIESVRLAETLAALRDRPVPGLDELHQAVLTVMCFGDPTQLRLINRDLTIGERLGAVPADTPMVPIQRDIEALQKRLRMKVTATQETLDLDLRTPSGIGRSQLLHRLNLLGINWGDFQGAGAQGKGTFHELWALQWQPEFIPTIIEAAIWGNTVADAAAAKVSHDAKGASLPTLAALIDAVLMADLPEVIATLTQQLEAAAARSGDVVQLMEALPPLANVRRYGNVRQTDTSMISHVLDGLVVRVCVGLSPGCSSLDDDAARAMLTRIGDVTNALDVLQDPDYQTQWYQALRRVADQAGINNLLSGRCIRRLLDADEFTADDVEPRMSRALSRGAEPEEAAGWIEGFLAGSGMILLYDDRLWTVLDTWISSLTEPAYTAVLPLIRRTFSAFSSSERQQMGQRIAAGSGPRTAKAETIHIDHDRAARVLPLVTNLLGLAHD